VEQTGPNGGETDTEEISRIKMIYEFTAKRNNLTTTKRSKTTDLTATLNAMTDYPNNGKMKETYRLSRNDGEVMTSILRPPCGAARRRAACISPRSRLAPRSTRFCWLDLTERSTGLPTPALLSIIFTISFIPPTLGSRAVPIH